MRTPATSLQAVTENLMADEANRKLLRAAELGDAEAQRRIGDLYAEALWYDDGGNFKQACDDDVAEEAYKWFERAAQQGDAIAQFTLALSCWPDFPAWRGFDGQPPSLRNDPTQTLKWMRAAAEQGEELAFGFMGDMYAFGIGGALQDFPEAAKWYCLDRDATGLTCLLLRHSGQFSKDDESLLVNEIREKASNGCRFSQRKLGHIYARGLFWLAVDEAESVKWHSLASTELEECSAFGMTDIEVLQRNAERCGARLQRHLGQLFERENFLLMEEYLLREKCSFKGDQWPGADPSEAARWYELSAAQGDAWSQLRIALMYDQGEGVSQNDELAAKWYVKAAEQGLSSAQNNLGTLYHSGRGVEQNYRLARRWFLAAARQGDESALYNLGLIYRHGQGVREDKTLAQRWYSASAMRGYVWAKIALALVTEDQDDLLRATESLFTEHRKANLGRMEHCVSQLAEFCERLDDLATRPSTPAIAQIWQSRSDGPNSDQRQWWRKLSATAQVATTLRGMLILMGDGRDETAARTCFQLAEKNGDLLAAYYLANLEWQNESYDVALSVIERRYVSPGTADAILDEIIGHRDVAPFKRRSDQWESSGYSEEFLASLDLLFRALDRYVRDSKTEKKLHQARIEAAEEEHKRTLSFLTHTLNNTLSTGPETVRTVIEILGSDLYDQGQEQYKAINNMASLFPVFLFVESLLKTFKLYVSDPEQLREKWDNDRSGDATVSLVMAMALRQSIARFVFSPNHLGQLRRLLPGQDKEAIKQARKSFVEEMIPLEISVGTAGKVFDWVKTHFGMLQVEIAADAEMRFSSNATRYMFLFAAFSELLYNALKYSDGARPIQLRWYRDGSDYCFTCVNSCPVRAGAQSTQEGSNGGLFFIDKLMSMLRESALSYGQDDGEHRALLRFDHNNFGERNG